MNRLAAPLRSICNLTWLTPEDIREEHVACLVEARHVRIERIVSLGQASPPRFWYDQPWAAWVVVLAGSAGLRFEDEAEVKVLSEGDYIRIPARVKHRVEWTSEDRSGSPFIIPRPNRVNSLRLRSTPWNGSINWSP
jgi:cupin 2 domain-containing protein